MKSFRDVLNELQGELLLIRQRLNVSADTFCLYSYLYEELKEPAAWRVPLDRDESPLAA